MGQREGLERQVDMEERATERYPVTTIESPAFIPAIAPIMQELLSRHDIKVVIHKDHYLLTFPEGTYKTELLPRLHNALYKLVLPDGYTLLETTIGATPPRSYLQFEVDTLDADIRDRLLALDALPLELRDKLQSEKA